MTGWLAISQILTGLLCLWIGLMAGGYRAKHQERRRVRKLIRAIILELSPTPLFGGFMTQVDRDRKPPAWPPVPPDGITPPKETRYIVARLEAIDEAVELGVTLKDGGRQEPVDPWPDPPKARK